ncbi:Clp protease ClpP [Priestia megaterium]|nr:Clp protease ClpP [Priestia megaterium]
MTVKIEVKGPIISNDEQWIYDLFEMDATSPKKVFDQLAEANGDAITVAINSPGGYVYEGSEIYTALKSYNGHVETQIVGLAASAASFIAMSGSKVSISPTAQIMIHNASKGHQGDHRSMQKASDMLRVIDNSIVNAYVIKTGKPEQELLDMMAEETWLGAKEALDNGFVDEIMFMENELKATASSATATMIPEPIINGLRNGILNKGAQDNITKDVLQASLTELKNEILNELNSHKLKEPTPAESKQKLSKLFLNL